MTYFRGVSSVPYATDAITAYVHSGWMDSIHTYGDFSQVNQQQTDFRRQLAIQAVQELERQHDMVDVWIDHGNKSNVDNFGAYGSARFYNYQQWANPWSAAYHTDWTIPYGIHFVWPDKSSDILSRSSMIYPLRLPDGRTVWGGLAVYG